MKTKFIAGIVCLMILSVIVIPVTATNLLVNSNKKAAVYINGTYFGTTPVNISLKPGTYNVSVVSGNFELHRIITLKNNSNNSSNIANFNFTLSVETGKFRLAPVVRVRPVNDVVTKGHPGLVEFYFSNPTINDVPLTVDVYVSVPSGVHVSGEGFSTGGAAGTIHGHFKVPPGSDKSVYMNIVGEKIGKYFIHVEVIYYPGNKKDNFQQISLTHPFNIIEPVSLKSTPISNVTQNFAHPINLTWIILIAVVLGGIAIIFGMIRRPPKIEIEEK